MHRSFRQMLYYAFKQRGKAKDGGVGRQSDISNEEVKDVDTSTASIWSIEGHANRTSGRGLPCGLLGGGLLGQRLLGGRLLGGLLGLKNCEL